MKEGYIDGFSEGLIRFKKDDKIGYKDESGNIVIKPKYYYAKEFTDGAAIVRLKNNMYAIINRQGRFITNKTYNFIEYINDGMFLCKKNHFNENNTTVSIINNKGEEIVKNCDWANYFNEGYCVFYKNHKCYLIDKNGKVIIENKNDIRNVSNGFTLVLENTPFFYELKTGRKIYIPDNERYAHIIDIETISDFEKLSDQLYTSIITFKEKNYMYRCSIVINDEGKIILYSLDNKIVSNEDHTNTKFVRNNYGTYTLELHLNKDEVYKGLVDSNGNLIVDYKNADYTKIDVLNGIAIASTKSLSGPKTLYDFNGNKLSQKRRYTSIVDSGIENIFIAQYFDRNHKKKETYLNNKAEEIFENSINCGSFKDGLAIVSKHELSTSTNDLQLITRFSIINSNFEIIRTFPIDEYDYELEKLQYIEDLGLFIGKYKGINKFIIVDKDGNILNTINAQNIYANKYIITFNNGKYGVLGKNGNRLCDEVYDNIKVINDNVIIFTFDGREIFVNLNDFEMSYEYVVKLLKRS